MPTTATGFPYPTEQDTPDVPRDIKALSDYLETRVVRAVLSGNVPVPVNPAANNGTAAVTFPVGKFAATPVVVVSTSGTSFWCAFTSGIGVGGFTATVRHIDGTAAVATPTVAWTATLN